MHRSCPGDKSVRIVLVGDTTGTLDEGMKKTTHSLVNGLSANNEVLIIHPRQAFRQSTLHQVRRLRPHVIHYTHGPSVKSVLVARWLAAWAGDAKVVLSALHPRMSALVQITTALVRPDLIFVQSEKARRFFQIANCRTAFLPNGVDLGRFNPVSNERKLELRREYGIVGQDFVVLHVGSVQDSRNLGGLADLQQELDIQVLVVGSTTEKAQISIVETLRSVGCIVWLRFFEHVEHLFQLADCYLFLVEDELGCIQMPLTVLEAAACNLHVVTTPFGGLPHFLPEGTGLRYIEGTDEARVALRACVANGVPNTRALVERFCWESVCEQILAHYRDLLSAER